MSGASELLRSGRGVVCASLLLCSVVLVVVGQMPVSLWCDYTKWIATLLVAGRTVTHALESRGIPAARVVSEP